MSENNIENEAMIERMQKNWTAWGGLTLPERDCLANNWAYVQWNDCAGFETIEGDPADWSISDSMVLRISPDYKPEPVTRWFFLIHTYEIHNSRDMTPQTLIDSENDPEVLEVKESDLPYLEKPEVTDGMKNRGEDWVFKKVESKEVFTIAFKDSDTLIHGHTTSLYNPQIPLSERIDGHRWVKVRTKPEQDIAKMISELETDITGAFNAGMKRLKAIKELL